MTMIDVLGRGASLGGTNSGRPVSPSAAASPWARRRRSVGWAETASHRLLLVQMQDIHNGISEDVMPGDVRHGDTRITRPVSVGVPH